jgi:hypothetical protein
LQTRERTYVWARPAICYGGRPLHLVTNFTSELRLILLTRYRLALLRSQLTAVSPHWWAMGAYVLFRIAIAPMIAVTARVRHGAGYAWYLVTEMFLLHGSTCHVITCTLAVAAHTVATAIRFNCRADIAFPSSRETPNGLRLWHLGCAAWQREIGYSAPQLKRRRLYFM